ncbi:glutaredoxin [Annulohypoxylon maeteangense]|uniref:glutaredoxin n=1 Tax=Annulohypoxylon maeteangense TaxID=1927788 RepID=UPI002008D0FD|nr:glutaredoxin [Annulohypoxylon maeteangense]KAI0889415.1 glutaredoxin [Annulohypoxylon maeteangense]
MAPLTEITTLDEWQAHVGSLPSSTLLIVYFYAPWAAPCTQMRTVLEALKDELKEPASWVSINAEDLSDVSEMYDVMAVPYVVLQRNDQVIESISGSNAAVVRTAIEKQLKSSSGQPQTNGTSATTNNGDASSADKMAVDDELSPEEELNKRLAGLVKAAPVMLFMKGTPSAPQCGFSRQMVAILRERSVKYGFFNILADDDVRQGLKKFADWPTYPQLWVSGELVGGLDIVKEELEGNPDYFKQFSVLKEDEAAAA